MCLPYYDDEDAEDNQYADFDTWITFSDIEKIIDLDILIENQSTPACYLLRT